MIDFPQPGSIRWYWILVAYYIRAFFYYLFLGAYLVCLYPKKSWDYVRSVWPSWSLIRAGIDKAYDSFIERMFK